MLRREGEESNDILFEDAPPEDSASRLIFVLGKESVGKSLLVSQLTGKHAYSANFAGSTVSCDFYTDAARERTFIDAPGILRRSDTEAARAALARLDASGTVLLVAQATHLDDDLRDLLPLLKGKRAAVAVTFWDKLAASVAATEARAALERLASQTELDFVPLDARHVGEAERLRLLQALDAPRIAQPRELTATNLRRITPRRTIFDLRFAGAGLALLLLLAPALLAVWTANSLAAAVEPLVGSQLKPLAASMKELLPAPLSHVLAGSYGLLTMTPLMFVWAAPVVVFYAMLLAAYKASGLIDRLTVAVEPLVRPFGLTGRDLVRVLMGMGCNVPAVIATRSCSFCTRGTCISAIAFGAACSYQLGATLAVFAAANRPMLVFPYLAYLTLTTLAYTRLVSPREARAKRNLLVIQDRTFLTIPRVRDVWREARSTLVSFFRQALPIFLLITLAASLFEWLGIISKSAELLKPVMSLFNLPAEAALAVVFAAIRKDGILLLAEPKTLAGLSSVQILTGVYLAGVLLPCLVTLLAIGREQGWRFAARLLARQLLAAIVFSLLLAWVDYLFR